MSEYIENEYEYEIRVERLCIIIYSVYSVLIMYVSSRQDWGMLVFMTYLAALAVCWSMYLTKSMTFRFRAGVTSGAMLVGAYTFSVISGELVNLLPIFIAIVILIGLYEIPELIMASVGVTILLYLHHGLLLRDIPFGESGDGNLRLVLRLIGVFVAEYAAYYLVYNQKQARRRQAGIIEELKEAEQSRDDFLANVSHELRTPINTINGMSEMLLRDELTDQIRQEVFNIQSASKNLLSIVSDILDYSELQGGEMELISEEYNITSTINDVINMTMAKKGDKNIEFIVDCDPTLPRTIKGDEQKVRRVIMNLINNAIKYTQTGCVLFKVDYRREAYGINLIVGVRDTGIGMTRADIEKLFNSFGQIDTKRNRKDSGIGLGLAISSAIVDAMGGFISVKSEYGTGTSIRFSIPQEVVDGEPIAVVEDPEKIRACAYFNMEQFELQIIRNAYSRNMERFTKQLGVDITVCRNLGELKRRLEREKFTHVFISLFEYKQDRLFFDEIATKTRLVVVLERWQEQELRSPEIHRLYKPFYGIPMAVFLNNKEKELLAVRNRYHHERFIAPDAHILIVDDNLLNIKVAEGLLKPYMIRTSHALSGKEALEMVKSQVYDFVFMDHMMPEMDGIECLEHIREIKGAYFAKVPVIALTANAIGGTREMFLEKGFADFVAKPIELSVLERVLRRNLPKDKITVISESEAARLGQRFCQEAGDGGQAQAPVTGYGGGAGMPGSAVPGVGAPIAGGIPQAGTGMSAGGYAGAAGMSGGGASAAGSAGVAGMPGSGGPAAGSAGVAGMPVVGAPVAGYAGAVGMHGAGAPVSGGMPPAGAAYQGYGAGQGQQPAGALVVGDLDVAQGETYCGGTESYIDILKIQAEDDATMPKILDCYEKKKWKDYVILVHGVKSTMKSIGAQPLSDMAKGLEFAGKASDLNYIYDNHEAFVKEFARVQDMIRRFFAGDNGEEAAGNSSMPEISEQEFKDTMAEFESAMYSMDEGAMRTAMEHLSLHQYKGRSLNKELKNVFKKVEMADYFSAYDTLETVFKRLDSGKGGQE